MAAIGDVGSETTVTTVPFLSYSFPFLALVNKGGEGKIEMYLVHGVIVIFLKKINSVSHVSYESRGRF
jgi:hypothetical protein